jgi:beta-N-acetylhexosaminidase
MPSDALSGESVHLGQILFIGIEGGALTPATRGILERVRPGGVVLFRRNVPSLPDLSNLCVSLKEAIDPPPLIAIDEEGGRVTRLSPHVDGLPAASRTAAAGPGPLREYWARYGALLFTLGIEVDFAPVLDLCPPDAPNGIADRSFGISPGQVIECGRAVVEGLSRAGILPVLKHFPGLGPTMLDSHHHLPTLRKDRAAFEREDLAPYLALGGDAPAVMVGHGHYPFYSGEDPLAATLSPAVSTGLLRETVGFQGTAISDDLEMKAVSARIPWEELIPRVVVAGNDMLLICHSPERILSAFEALRRRAGEDEAFARRCREAIRRIEALRGAGARLRGTVAGASAGPASPARIEAARAALIGAAASFPGNTA